MKGRGEYKLEKGMVREIMNESFEGEEGEKQNVSLMGRELGK